MAKKKKNKKSKENKNVMFNQPLRGGALLSQLDSQHESADSAISNLRDTWDAKERMLLGQTDDNITEHDTKSRVYDPRLSSIVIERSARVMARLPTGVITAVSGKDSNRAKARLMQLVFDDYVLPNANEQFSLPVKLRLWDMYSLVYGSMPMLYDWVQTDDYVGPDVWLVPIRNYKPQAGKYHVDNMDYVFIDNMVTLDWLLDQPADIWTGVDKIANILGKDGAGKKREGEETQSWVEREFGSTLGGGKGRYANVLLRTRYERDRWVTYAPDYDVIVRDIKNPHENNKIPIVMKHTLPLLDRVTGMGEMERGETLQYAVNALINLYLDGVKKSISPPRVVNPDGVVPASLQDVPGATWLETIPNSIRTFNVSPQGINSFTSTYGFLTSALLNQAGTTDVTSSALTEPALGRTPQGLKMTQGREQSRDAWDRFMMEQAVGTLFDRMINLIGKIQDKPIRLDIFDERARVILKDYPELAKEVGDGGAELLLSAEDIGGVDYNYKIDIGTTMKVDDQIQNRTLTTLMMTLMKVPGVAEQIPKGKITIGDKEIDFGELFKRWVVTSGVQETDKIVNDLNEQELQQRQEKEQQSQMQRQMLEKQLSQLSPEGQQWAAQNLLRGAGMVGGVPQK